MQNNTTTKTNSVLITATNSATNSAKTYTHAGITLHPAEHIGWGVHVGNSAKRFAKDLGGYGHTHIRAIELSKACTKLEAAEELLANEHFADEHAQTVIKAFIAKATKQTATLITA